MRSEGEVAKGERRETARLAINHHLGTRGRRADEKTARFVNRCRRRLSCNWYGDWLWTRDFLFGDWSSRLRCGSDWL
jgi:hypothetical protein